MVREKIVKVWGTDGKLILRLFRTGDLIKSFRRGEYKKFKNLLEEVKGGAEFMEEWDCNTIAV